MSAGKVTIGVLVGVAIGSILGMLLAPEKGILIRKKLIKKGNDLIGKSEEQINGLIGNASKKFQPIDTK